MKKRQCKGLIAFFLAFLYIFGLFAGIYITNRYPLRRQRTHYEKQAAAIAEEYIDGKDTALQKMIGPNTHILICDVHGDPLRHVLPVNAQAGQSDLPFMIDEHFLRLQQKGAFSRYCFAQSNHWWDDIYTLVAAPIFQNETLVGAVFLLRKQVDMPGAILSYACYFTAFFWIAAFCIVSTNRRKRKLDEIRQNYLDNISHALKTPVASIKALAETLCDGVEPDPERQQLYCSMILQEANRQDHMIRDALELSKLQNRGTPFAKNKALASDVLNPTLNKYADLFDYAGITLHRPKNLNAIPPLHTNATCVCQVLGALLDNALKFVPETGNVWLDLQINGKQVVFCVRDDGIGITEDALPHVFDRFYKYNHDFNESGSGLGLAIAREIIRGLNEKIWAESEVGAGTAFFFTVRLA